MSNTNMTKGEREAFLAMPWIAVVSISEAGRGPLTVPVWYAYEPGGDVHIWTGKDTYKGRLLKSVARISVCVQDPKPPYRYASVEGPVSITAVDFEQDVRPMAYRYFGKVRGDQYLASIGGSAGVTSDILVSVHPERWLTVDYSKIDSLA
jgi:hypothetical protein